ncbi:MAG TPA: hypothetical protein VD902_09860 [Symbiobacteriaceae bacterium]|nr:hypothetical protein [Symbiobacteriaceae bacterium]
MRGALIGLALTGLVWAVLTGMYAMIEAIRGNVPFAMLQWDMGGKYLTLTILSVMALGAGIGYASDRMRRRVGR